MLPIVDVARAAGVSVSTVSRVLNNANHPIHPETRERVLEAARALGYWASPLARALVTKQSGLVGVIVGDATDPYFAAISRGVEDVARHHGYLVVICNSDRIPAVELNYVRMLASYQADGIIFAGGGLTDTEYLAALRPAVTDLHQRGVPIVTIGHHLFSSRQVNIDNVAATRDMTEYLIHLGHRAIALIDGPAGLTTSDLRGAGYRDAMAAHGLAVPPALVVPGAYTYESGLRAGRQLLESKPRPTAIFASNDLLALGCLSALKEAGVRVPDEISLAGFDNITATQYVAPPLTTVDVPMMEMGAEAMRRVIGARSGDPHDETRWLPHRLVVRASTAPPDRGR